MPKTLFLLRHAKSSWDDPRLGDFDRPLAKRGREAAPRMGQEMVQRGWLPDMALISPSLRTRQTWALVSAELPRPPEVAVDHTVYEASAARILEAIRATPERIPTLLVVGHNPGLEELAAMLASPDSDAGALAQMAKKFPTAALARFTFDGTWSHLVASGARLDAFVLPKELD